jgi:hypothetical protein
LPAFWSVTSWPLRGNGIGSSNGRFQPVVLRDTMATLLRDMGNVDQAVLKPVAIEDFAARAPHEGAGLLRRQFLTGCPHCIFPLIPVPLVAPRLKIAFGSFGKKRFPGGFKIGARLVEGRSATVRVLARLTARIETARPASRIFIVRNAAADRARAGVHIPVVDVPAFLAGVSRSVAG